MDFLKDAALPQSLEHFRLLLFILNLTFIVFMPYAGFLLGAAFLAHREERRGRMTNNPMRVTFARDLVDIVLANKSIPAFLGLLPALALVFLYAQLLQRTPAISVGLAGFGFLFLLASTALLYAYKYTFDLADVLEHVPDAGRSGSDARAFAARNAVAHERTGRWGLILGFVALFLLTSAVAVTVNPSAWVSVDSVWSLLLSADVYIKFLQFMAFALGMTGLGILFFFFSWEGGRALDPGYAAYAKKKAIDLAVVSLLLQPALILLSVAVLPAPTLSGLMIGLAGAAILLLMLALQFLYALHKEHRAQYAGYAFFALICASAFSVTKDQLAIGNATKEHAAALVVAFDKATEELRARVGVAGPALTGEDIYNGRCSACHLYDAKKVGPPYNLVVPKYAGKRGAMVAFVLNPVKVDPAYPNMPNQGLKPAEADSIVSFLFRHFGQK